MERRQFGRTDMRVSVLGFGGVEIALPGADRSHVSVLLNTALDAGLNVIDTAECYDDSERLIGEAVSHRREEFFLFSKCGHAVEGDNLPDWHPDLLRSSIDRSLRLLKTDHLDLIQLHSCSEELLRQGDVIEVVKEAKAAGKARYIGYSGDGPKAVYAIETGVFDSLQTSLNIADQESVELLLPRAKAAGMGVIAKRPVANVAWHNGDKEPDRQYALRYWERLKELRYPFLQQPLQDSVEIALRFTLSFPEVSTAIVGTGKPQRWQQNAAAVAKGPLTESEVEAIRSRWKEKAPPEWVGLT